jgi:hypothetical protein
MDFPDTERLSLFRYGILQTFQRRRGICSFAVLRLAVNPLYAGIRTSGRLEGEFLKQD